MSLGLKNVDSISTRRYRSKPHHKLYRHYKSAFHLLTRLYGNGDVAGVMSAGMGRRYVLNVLTGFMQLMRKGCIDSLVPNIRSGRDQNKKPKNINRDKLMTAQ